MRKQNMTRHKIVWKFIEPLLTKKNNISNCSSQTEAF